MDGPDLRSEPRPQTLTPAAAPARHGGTMIVTAATWHLLIFGAVVLLFTSEPVDSYECELVCSHYDQFLLALLVGGAPLTLGLFVTIAMIIAMVHRTRNITHASGRRLAPANRWRDAALATGLTLIGLLGATAAIGSYLLVGQLF